MTYSILPEAREEFKKAFVHYENNQQGLGSEFSDEFYAALDPILSFPRAWPVFDEGNRRILFNTFPFSIIYSIDEE